MERPMDFRLPALNGVFVTACLLLAALLLPCAAFGQVGAFGSQGKPHITASLIAESPTPAAGSTVTLAIVMKPERGWHGYWENPGDAGTGLQADWTLPRGASVSALRYPVPQRLLISGLMNHVYEHDYTILVELALPVGLSKGTRIQVRASAQWLACTDSICVPEQGLIATELTIGEGQVDAASRATFDGFRSQLPRPLDQQASYAVSGQRIAISVPYPAGAAVGQPWFYALSKNRLRYAEPQAVRRVDDRLVVETAIAPGAAATGLIEGVLAVSPAVALRVSAVPGPVPSGGTNLTATNSEATRRISLSTVLFALGGALLGGLLLNIMPCVFPILSLKAISLSRAGGQERQVRGEALAYTSGILLTCLALGALMLAVRAAGSQIGWAFQLQDPRVIALLLLLMVTITLNLAGLFEIGAIGLGQGRAMQSGHSGAFWTGALAAFVATPCTGPFMGAAMGAALILPWPVALVIFAGLGLGLASPFLAIAYVPRLRAFMPRPGGWMNTFRRFMAVPMGLTALGLLWLLSRQAGSGGLWLGLTLMLGGALLLFVVGRRQQSGSRHVRLPSLVAGAALCVAAVVAPPLVATPKNAVTAGLSGAAFSEARLASLRTSGKPVFLYFTADWCLTCKVNEANAIDTEAVRTAFGKAGIKTLVGDWTNADSAISRFLEANGRSGVPLYLYYAPGAATPKVLPQVLTQSMLTDLVKG